MAQEIEERTDDKSTINRFVPETQRVRYGVVLLVGLLVGIVIGAFLGEFVLSGTVMIEDCLPGRPCP